MNPIHKNMKRITLLAVPAIILLMGILLMVHDQPKVGSNTEKSPKKLPPGRLMAMLADHYHNMLMNPSTGNIPNGIRAKELISLPV